MVEKIESDPLNLLVKTIVGKQTKIFAAAIFKSFILWVG